MKFRMFVASAALLVAAAAPLSAAQAGTQEEVDQCKAALEAKAPDAKFDFKRKSGGSLAKYKFEMTTADGETKDVECKVKRGEIKELDMEG